VGEPQGIRRLQRYSVSSDTRKKRCSLDNNGISMATLPDRENRAAAALENKCQNPGQTCKLVITAYKHLNVTLTKITLKWRGQRPRSSSNSEGLRVNIAIFGNLRNRAVPRKRRTTALLSFKYLFGVPITHLSCYSFSRDLKQFEQL